MPLCGKITIVGLGLIGGSVGLAARRRRLAARVVGLVRRRESVREAARLGVADEATLDPAAALRGADVVILAVPVGSIAGVAALVRPHLAPRCLVTDAASVKRPVVARLERAFPGGAHFVGAHPIAGSERSGMAAARPDLFEGSVCIITPTPRTDRGALRSAQAFWEGLGARVVRMSPVRHDRIMAAVSHLPHLVAAALVNSVAGGLGCGSPALGFAGTGFRDTTRIAAGPPAMWSEILIANRGHILRAARSFRRELDRVVSMLEEADGAGLDRRLGRAAAARRRVRCANHGCEDNRPVADER
ncbi:MAG: prephenate dehydrogenase [bacterium]|nr:prephenate dehydrogenase [bacterium]